MSYLLRDPALDLFLMQLQAITEIDPIGFADWFHRHKGQLSVSFSRSNRPEGEAAVWIREQYMRSLGVNLSC